MHQLTHAAAGLLLVLCWYVHGTGYNVENAFHMGALWQLL